MPFRHNVSESDVDWVLCMEINSNSPFRRWLGQQLFGFDFSHVEAWRSVPHPTLGESDLLWLVQAGGGRHLAMIENKINAAAQPQQCQRYARRGQSYVEEGICTDYRTVLIAPSRYHTADAAGYEHRIDYETIRTWFQEALHDDRAQFVTKLLEAAVTKATSVPPPDPKITEFRMKTWELAEREFPELNIDRPGETREAWVIQKYDGYYIKLKSFSTAADGFYRSVVDLELPGQAGEVEPLRHSLARDLAELNATIEPAGKSAAIRIEVPCVNPPEFEEAVVRNALLAWKKLLTWWRLREQA